MALDGLFLLDHRIVLSKSRMCRRTSSAVASSFSRKRPRTPEHIREGHDLDLGVLPVPGIGLSVLARSLVNAPMGQKQMFRVDLLRRPSLQTFFRQWSWPLQEGSPGECST